MKDDPLNEREFELINILGPQISANQRDLSRHLDLSLGMTNMLIRRLIAKGYIRIRQLNKRKVEYLLTPKGFAEKMRKSMKYTVKTINSIGLINDKLDGIISDLYASGCRRFFLLGESDLVILVERIFQDPRFAECRIGHLPDATGAEDDAVCLICTEQIGPHALNGRRQVNLIEELARDRLGPQPAGLQEAGR